TPSPIVLSTLESAELIVVCPSNPLVSVAPILAVPGVRAALGAAEAPKVAVSPIVGGSALRGPADRMLESLGYEVSPVGVARLYKGLLDGFVMDGLDEALASEVGSLGLEVLVTNTVMQDQPDREALADEVLRWGRTLARGGKVVR
ncbi:MAG: 2-phospho-L-lactate transferase CofD family protein, partial [Chloroflexota bacterium]|nr:2-phospho-L-lactate transferase CofD family protein [Chloroflexota bacterium]